MNEYQYTRVYQGLRERILRGEFGVGERIPTIAQLQDQYDIQSLSTIRTAQQKLVDEGLIRTMQGRGAFVISTDAPDQDLDAALTELIHQARTIRSRLAAQGSRSVTIDLDDRSHPYAVYVLTEALREFEARCHIESDNDDDSNVPLRAESAREAAWILDLVRRNSTQRRERV